METFRVTMEATPEYYVQVRKRMKYSKEDEPYFFYHTQREVFVDVTNPTVEFDISAHTLREAKRLAEECCQHVFNRGHWSYQQMTLVSTIDLYLPTKEDMRMVIARTTNMFQKGLLK